MQIISVRLTFMFCFENAQSVCLLFCHNVVAQNVIIFLLQSRWLWEAGFHRVQKCVFVSGSNPAYDLVTYDFYVIFNFHSVAYGYCRSMAMTVLSYILL
jgi:hypothetical protein